MPTTNVDNPAGLIVQVARVLFPIAYLPSLSTYEVFEEPFNEDLAVTLPLHHVANVVLNVLNVFFIPAALFHIYKLYLAYDSEARASVLEVFEGQSKLGGNQNGFAYSLLTKIGRIFHWIADTRCVKAVGHWLLEQRNTSFGVASLSL
eukprot:CAMPEP_0184041366 /NCGR_PEP_ID=MMETSP0955-20130417/61936_1 /TAXON_ID=627963 /ORGANISM="Aplanochytrium sp, Strain PBS07" /LENGTH=147 /DNA_ID=CAMNT_0026331609 /DNA_START=1915 /DNA_END=2355 /DNA_ORIENTATION=-